MTYSGDMMKECMRLQCEEMQKHRWIESEKAGRDLGVSAYLDWTKRYALIFRKWYKNEYGDIDGKYNFEHRTDCGNGLST